MEDPQSLTLSIDGKTTLNTQLRNSTADEIIEEITVSPYTILNKE